VIAQEGDVLAGKYRVDRVLGMGGMGVVVAAYHLQLDTKVAIKFMLPEALVNQDAVARFTREAKAAVRIKGEHVARVLDVGTLDNGAPFMVMEYLEGVDLAAWLAQNGRLPFEQAVEFVLQACEALAEAHSLGIVHRDLKPANLFVSRRADRSWGVKVLDFGISKMGGPNASGEMTRTDVSMGSPYYMSPEQLQSARDVDARADIWALGVILYELISGKAAFQAETLPSVVLKIMSVTPDSLTSLRPDVPAELEAAIFRCLEKDREQRYANVAELAAAIARFGSPSARASLDRISGIMQASGLSRSSPTFPTMFELSEGQVVAGTGRPWAKTESLEKKGKVAVVANALAIVLGVAAVAWFMTRTTSQAPNVATSGAPSATDPAPVIQARVPSSPSSQAVTPEPVLELTPPPPPSPPPSAKPRAPRTPANVSPAAKAAPTNKPAPPLPERSLLDDR
jgi:eukaryotic-like serine/threonine-protein kinase